MDPEHEDSKINQHEKNFFICCGLPERMEEEFMCCTTVHHWGANKKFEVSGCFAELS